MPGGGGGEPGPRIPAGAFGSLPGGADLPAAAAGQQPGGGLLAGQLHPTGHSEVEVRGDPQHIALAAAFQVGAQFGAAAIHLVPADVIQLDAISEDLGKQVDGQLPLGAEDQVGRQSHHLLPARVAGLLARDPLPRSDQRMPGLFPDIRQVHRGDPVGHLPRAPQIVALDPGGVLTLLDLPSLIDRPDRQATPPGPARGLIQPCHREPAHHRHCREGVPASPVEQPLGLIRRPVPGVLGDRPPVAPGDLAHQRGGVLARLQPRLHPHKARPQQSQQFSPLPPPQRGTYPGGSSRPRLCCRHTRMIARRLRQSTQIPLLRPRSQLKMAAAVLSHA
jgi:hypothetical protein